MHLGVSIKLYTATLGIDSYIMQLEIQYSVSHTHTHTHIHTHIEGNIHR